MNARKFTAALIMVASLAACGAPEEPAAPAAPEISATEQRIQDLAAINAALTTYHQANGVYPGSSGFQGYASNWGASMGADWIPGLQATPLPRDPSLSETPVSQYLYFSNGTDYKLIAHLTEDCGPAVETNGVRIDPARADAANCWAYGFWTEGGAAF
ncbi:MAG: hypothetical protein JNL81_16910 [Hyphomonadaceae bacterium]|nr:hypothetical protein [Hyphomonadaceae bacterium]